MHMKSITLSIPDMVDIDEKEAKTMLAAKFYEQSKLTLGQAAEMAGYTKRTFMELLGNYGVSIFSESERELENDILNARNYHI
jgi:predicted HTH domain antitoxin